MHPLFMTVLRRPDLLVTHANNYVGLVKEEVSQTLTSLKLRAIGGAVAAVAVILALIFTGIALMLGALHGFAWSLVLVPLVTWLVVGIGVFMAVKPNAAAGVQELKGQLNADLMAIKIAGEPHA